MADDWIKTADLFLFIVLRISIGTEMKKYDQNAQFDRLSHANCTCSQMQKCCQKSFIVLTPVARNFLCNRR